MKAYFEVKNTRELCKLLGLPVSDAPRVEIRRNLVVGIKRAIEKRAWTHAQAADKAMVGRTVITGIVNGNIEKISTDRLIEVATNLGVNLELKVA